MLPHEVPRRGRGMFPQILPHAYALAAAATLACASSSGRSPQGRPHPVDVEVHNNLLVPTDLTVYVAPAYGSGRMLLGSVLPARTQTLRFTPSSFSETYRLYATAGGRRTIRSQPFTVGSGMTGTIVWTLVPNIVGFEELGDSTVTDTTRPAPPPTP